MKDQVLVINLTRFGDLLQSQSLLDDLALADYKTQLLCLENFAGAVRLMRHVEHVWPLKGSRLLAQLNSDWAQALQSLHNFIEEIMRRGKPQYVLNLTPTLAARLLTHIFETHGVKPLGFGLDEYGFGVNYTLWASFISVAARKRVNAPFNLSDMLRKLALPLSKKTAGSSALALPSRENIIEIRDRLAKEFGSPAASVEPKGFIAFQLGASEPKRQWPIENFQKLGRVLWERYKICPILTGSDSEAYLGEQFDRVNAQNNFPYINAIGKTSLEQLAALLTQCKLLVTNDTGTMHLASGLGVPCLAFFLATAQPWDTGPLLPGCCCLEPLLDCHPCAFDSKCMLDYRCKKIISTDTVTDLIDGWLNNGKWQLTERASSEVRAYQTAKDKNGIARLIPLSFPDSDQRILWLTAMRQFWNKILDKMDGAENNLAEDKKRESGEEVNYPASLRKLSEAQKIAESLIQASRIMDSLQESSRLAKVSSKGGSLILKNSERIRQIFEQVPLLDALGAFWQEFINSQGKDLDTILKISKIFREEIINLADALTA